MKSVNDTIFRRAEQFAQREFSADEAVAVGGSVARSGADEFSDIDLTIFRADDSADRNVDDSGYIIQLHFERLPDVVQVLQNPWAFRFLDEMKIISDRNGRLKSLQHAASSFFHSAPGRARMIAEVRRLVQERLAASRRLFESQRALSATHAAMGAWSEAAFLRLYLQEGSLSTDRLIPFSRQDRLRFEAFQHCSSICTAGCARDFSPVLHELRHFLSARGVNAPFDLDPLQEMLVRQKNCRLLRAGDPFALRWQMYGEALWLCFAADQPFEPLYASFPAKLKCGLSAIGFRALSERKLAELCRLSRAMIDAPMNADEM
ncbi:MAG: nucleotidyltransferase domain-containing protein [Sporolactobacillus sp.]|jgi:predicted nucleotidyltransferase|nr:nucleotidyltransferase domain-containing protein [Sporolactobacillus sp.]